MTKRLGFAVSIIKLVLLNALAMCIPKCAKFIYRQTWAFRNVRCDGRNIADDIRGDVLTSVRHASGFRNFVIL